MKKASFLYPRYHYSILSNVEWFMLKITNRPKVKQAHYQMRIAASIGTVNISVMFSLLTL